jgi:hypothetical protein
LRDTDWTKILGWPGYRVYQHEVDEKAKTLKLWVRRKRGNQVIVCSGCGRRCGGIHEVVARAVRDLPSAIIRKLRFLMIADIRWGLTNCFLENGRNS